MATKRPYTFTETQQQMLKELAALHGRKQVKVVRKKKETIQEPEPEPEPVPEPVKEHKRVKHKYVKKEKQVYPYLGDREAMDDVGLYGAVAKLQKTAREGLDKNNIRCTVPLAQMAAAAKSVRETLAKRRVERFGSSLPALDATLDEAFSEFSETTCQMDKSIFKMELRKYQVIAAAQLDKLETSTLLNMVMDLMKGRSNMKEYETGGPEKPSTAVNKFFGLTRLQYRCLTDHQKLTLLKEHTKRRYKYYKEYEAHLNSKYRALREQTVAKKKGKKASQISNYDPFKHWPEGRMREEELSFAFDRCRDMQRFLHMEFVRLSNKEEDCVLIYNDVWRHMYLKEYLNGQNGPLTEEEEHNIDRTFAKTPLDELKRIADLYMEEEWEDDGEEEEEEEEVEVQWEDGMEMENDGNDKEDKEKDTMERIDVNKELIISEKDVLWDGDEEEVTAVELEEEKEKEKESDEKDLDWNKLEGEIKEMRLDEVKEGAKENEGTKKNKKKNKKKKRKDKLQLITRQPREASPPVYMAVTPAYHTRYDPI